MASFGKKIATQPPGSDNAGGSPCGATPKGRAKARWHYWFLFTAIWYAIQTVPYIGAPLMLVAAMGWSIVTINAGFIAIVVDRLRGAVPAWLLVAPALWFGGYLTAAVIDQFRVADVQRGINAQNAGVSVPFDPERHSLVGGPNTDIAQRLARAYSIPVAYDQFGGSGAELRSVRIYSYEVCDLVRNDKALIRSGIHVMGVKAPGSQTNNECQLRRAEQPPLPPYTVSAVARQGQQPGTRFVDHVLTTPDGVSAKVVSGTTSALPWIPMPILGCGLGQGKWVCRQDFMRMPAYLDTDVNGADAVARAMGLKKREPGEPPPGGTGFQQVESLLRVQASGRLNEELALLDRVLANPRHPDKAKLWQLNMLRGDASSARDRAGKMAATLDILTDADTDAAKALIAVIGALQDDALFQIAPQIVQTLDKDRSKYEQSALMGAVDDLLIRIADRGDLAAGLAARAFANNPVRGKPVQALCRMGPAAADEAAAVLLSKLEWASNNRYYWYQHQGIYLALLRMGWREQLLADPHSGAADQAKRGWYEGVLKSVSPASPPSVCDL